MGDWHSASNVATSGLSLATLAGLALRRRARRCYAFSVYALVVGIQGLRLTLAPEPASWSAWLGVEVLLRLLCMVVAIEIAVRLFGKLPEAARGARRALLGVFAFTIALLLLDLPVPLHPRFVVSTPGEVEAFEMAQRLLPRLAYGSAWLFAALYAVATRFALPLDPLHRLILMGFGSYLLLYSVTFATLPAVDLHARAVSAVQTLSFLCLLGLWSYAAWRREPEPLAPADVVQRIWPWF